MYACVSRVLFQNYPVAFCNIACGDVHAFVEEAFSCSLHDFSNFNEDYLDYNLALKNAKYRENVWCSQIYHFHQWIMNIQYIVRI